MKIEAKELTVEVCPNFYEKDCFPDEDQIYLGVSKPKGFLKGYVFGALTVSEARDIAHALSELADWAESGGLMEDEPQ